MISIAACRVSRVPCVPRLFDFWLSVIILLEPVTELDVFPDV